MGNFVGVHRFEQRKRSGDIIAVVLGRIGHRFDDERRRREMKHCFRLKFLERFVQLFLFGKIGLDERPPFDRVGMASGKIIVGDG